MVCSQLSDPSYQYPEPEVGIARLHPAVQHGCLLAGSLAPLCSESCGFGDTLGDPRCGKLPRATGKTHTQSYTIQMWGPVNVVQ